MPFDSGISVVRADTGCTVFPDVRADTGCIAFPDVRADTGGIAFPDVRADTGCIVFPDVRADTGVCPYNSTPITASPSACRRRHRCSVSSC